MSNEFETRSQRRKEDARKARREQRKETLGFIGDEIADYICLSFFTDILGWFGVIPWLICLPLIIVYRLLCFLFNSIF